MSSSGRYRGYPDRDRPPPPPSRDWDAPPPPPTSRSGASSSSRRYDDPYISRGPPPPPRDDRGYDRDGRYESRDRRDRDRYDDRRPPPPRDYGRDDDRRANHRDRYGDRYEREDHERQRYASDRYREVSPPNRRDRRERQDFDGDRVTSARRIDDMHGVSAADQKRDSEPRSQDNKIDTNVPAASGGAHEEGETGAGDEDVDEEQQAMMAAMGFGGFGSTKGKKVDGNQAGYAEVRKERTWRQYMQRKGGFNRPLSPVRK